VKGQGVESGNTYENMAQERREGGEVAQKQERDEGPKVSARHLGIMEKKEGSKREAIGRKVQYLKGEGGRGPKMRN